MLYLSGAVHADLPRGVGVMLTDQRLTAMRLELVQVAAVAVATIEHIDEELAR